MTRIVAIMEGYDWNDAGVSHVEVPDDMDLGEMTKQHADWYRQSGNTKIPYVSFVEFLKRHGATDTDKVEEYWPDEEMA